MLSVLSASLKGSNQLTAWIRAGAMRSAKWSGNKIRNQLFNTLDLRITPTEGGGTHMVLRKDKVEIGNSE
jgi:hypothetical protein